MGVIDFYERRGFEIYVSYRTNARVSNNKNVIYKKNQRDATWQYVY
jgi:hypothetical protein